MESAGVGGAWNLQLAAKRKRPNALVGADDVNCLRRVGTSVVLAGAGSLVVGRTVSGGAGVGGGAWMAAGAASVWTGAVAAEAEGASSELSSTSAGECGTVGEGTAAYWAACWAH